MKYPVVIILSEGKETPENIISKIRKIPNTENIEAIYLGPSGDNADQVQGYIYELTTKYYKTNLYLVPFTKNVALLPESVRDGIEGILIYFDSENKNFTEKIPSYAKFIKENEIELGILLCDRLYDDPNDGITYKEAKQESKFLDVIELERTRDVTDENEEDDPNHHDPLGYDELLQAMRSFLWSNIQMGSAADQAYKTLKDETQVVGELPTPGDIDENAIEAELALFENLLSEVMMFRNTTGNWSRNERLSYAQKFADKFDELIGDGGPTSSSGGED